MSINDAEWEQEQPIIEAIERGEFSEYITLEEMFEEVEGLKEAYITWPNAD